MPKDGEISRERCPLMIEGDVMYHDDYHLSVKGARRTLPAFTGTFD